MTQESACRAYDVDEAFARVEVTTLGDFIGFDVVTEDGETFKAFSILVEEYETSRLVWCLAPDSGAEPEVRSFALGIVPPGFRQLWPREGEPRVTRGVRYLVVVEGTRQASALFEL